MFPELSVQVVHDDEGAVVTLTGVVEFGTSDGLFETITGVLQRDGLGRISVDLSGVTLLDGAGVGVLLAARNRALACGVRFRTIGAAGLTREVLEILGVLGLLDGKTEPRLLRRTR